MIEKKDVEHVANLARLYLEEGEAKKFASQLDRILEYAAKISELNTEEVKATSHAVALKNVLREDKVDHEVKREEVLKNAPENEEKAFKVPKIL